MFSCRQKLIDLLTSAAATCCGVVTATAPSGFSSNWQIERGSSPVPGRAIDDQIIQLAPIDVLEELLDDAHFHRVRAR